jgi:hypothetical protein
MKLVSKRHGCAGGVNVRAASKRRNRAAFHKNKTPGWWAGGCSVVAEWIPLQIT